MRENHPTPSTRLVPNTNIRGAGGVFFGTLDKCSDERLVGICEETEGDWFLQKVKEIKVGYFRKPSDQSLILRI